MPPTIAWQCKECKTYSEIEFIPGKSLSCPKCSKEWGRADPAKNIFDACPICQTRQFYIQKDFNQLLGCLVILIGILLVPKTYGLSLPIFAGIDWLIYRRIKTIAVCYRCGAEFRGFDVPKPFKPFLHHIGMKYDKYR